MLAADLVDREQLAAVEARLADPARPIDLLVNNAGFGLKRRFLDNPVDDEQAMLDVLVTAVMRLSHAALGPMAERGSGGDHQRVERGGVPAPRQLQRREGVGELVLRVGGLRVPRPGRHGHGLCPGFTKTEFHERMDVARGSAPDFLWLDADELVAEALKDHAKGKVWSIPGASVQGDRDRGAAGPDAGAQAVPVAGPEVAAGGTTGVARRRARRLAASSISRSYSSGSVVLQPRSWSTFPAPW